MLLGPLVKMNSMVPKFDSFINDEKALVACQFVTKLLVIDGLSGYWACQ